MLHEEQHHHQEGDHTCGAAISATAAASGRMSVLETVCLVAVVSWHTVLEVSLLLPYTETRRKQERHDEQLSL